MRDLGSMRVGDEGFGEKLEQLMEVRGLEGRGGVEWEDVWVGVQASGLAAVEKVAELLFTL
jgi:hypothetical protein